MKIKLPTSLMEIPVKDFIEFSKTEKTERDILKCFLHLNDDLISQMFVSDIREMVGKINQLFDGVEQFPFEPTFMLGKELFGFIPKFDDITLSEYADLSTFNNGGVEDVAKFLSVLYRPTTVLKDGNYLIEPYNSDITYHEIMLSAPIGIYFGAKGFFLTLKNRLLKITMEYLTNELEEMATSSESGTLEKNGGGIRASINSLKAMLEDLKKLED